MSSQTQASGLLLSIPGALDLSGEFDRVLITAAERPDPASLPVMSDPAADHSDLELRKRRADVEEKHDRVRKYLDDSGLDAVVLGTADSVAWFTSGGELGISLNGEAASIFLFVNRTSRAVVCDNVQSCRVFEEELAGLGFQLKERPWYDDPEQVVSELTGSKRVTSDVLVGSLNPERLAPGPIRVLRRCLTSLERQRLRELGRALAVALEATCRNFDRGERESDVAGHLAHRLLREGITPVDIRVTGDERMERYRQAPSKSNPIARHATIKAVGRRHGLCACASRTIAFGRASDELRSCHNVAAMVDGSSIFFSRPGELVTEVFRRSKRLYEKFSHPHAWTHDYQGFVIGYSPREICLRPDSKMKLESNMPIAWRPSVGGASSEDTVVVDARGYEIVTAAQDWPQIDVAVKGFVIPRPGILER